MFDRRSCKDQSHLIRMQINLQYFEICPQMEMHLEKNVLFLFFEHLICFPDETVIHMMEQSDLFDSHINIFFSNL